MFYFTVVYKEAARRAIATEIRRSAPPIAEGLGGGEAAGDRREQSLNLRLLLNVLLDDCQRCAAT
jgi:hypothetical protein